MKTLDIGCGKHKTIGAIGLDFVKIQGVDVVHDLNKIPYPFKNKEFDIIYANHVLEHLEINLDKMLGELCRICKSNGKIVIEVPTFPSMGTFSDPTHKKVFSYFTFDYFGSNEQSYYTKSRVKILKRKFICGGGGRLASKIFKPIELFINEFPKLYVLFPFLFPVTSMKFELQPSKDIKL